MRGDRWYDEPSHQITADEWTAFVDSDAELRWVDSGPASKRWAALSSAQLDEGQVLRYSNGSISADYPQRPLLRKMFQMARCFGGYLITDDGDIIGESACLSTDESPSVELQYEPLPTSAPSHHPWLLQIPPVSSDEILASIVRLVVAALPPDDGLVASRWSGQNELVFPVMDLEVACVLAEQLRDCGVRADVTGK